MSPRRAGGGCGKLTGSGYVTGHVVVDETTRCTMSCLARPITELMDPLVTPFGYGYGVPWRL